ncbi:uncharacterized protein V3H82_020437 isoform 2-T3 [Fundulus diaphanus]
MGGGRKTQLVSKAKYDKAMDRKNTKNTKNTKNQTNTTNTTELKDLPEGEVSIINTYNLGLVGTYNDVTELRRTNTNPNAHYNPKNSPVNADHIPPKDTFQKAFKMLHKPENEELKQSIKTKNPKLYKLIDKNGNCGRCMEVLTEHHLQALTTGNSKGAHLVREKLSEVLLSGDANKLLKMSLIVADPEMSENLRRDAGIHQQSKRTAFMSRETTRRYYTVGDKLLLDEYCEMGVIDQSAKDDLHDWTKSQLYSRNSPEYKELLETLTSSRRNQKH